MHLYLTNENYRNVLNIIAKSPEPLLISEIRMMMEKVGMKKSSSPYVYDMIKELAPTETSPLLLFRWDNLIDPKNDNKLEKLLKFLNATFRLHWTIGQDSNYSENYKSFFKKENESTFVIRSHDEMKKFLMIQITDSGKGTISIMNDNKKIRDYNIILKINSGKTYVYLNVMTSIRPRTFLSAIPKNDTRAVSEIKEEIKKNPRYSEQWGFNLLFLPDFYRDSGNSYDFKYRLNIRGLILYILAEGQWETKNKGSRLSQIDFVLKNLSINFVDDFPFLLYYNDFKNEFSVKSYYLPKLMREVAMELQYQVFSADLRFLMHWVLKRFSEEVIRHLVTPIVWGIWNSGNSGSNITNFDDKLRRYELRTISLLADYHQKEYLSAEADRKALMDNRLVSRF